ncbi:uncharacterized protein BJ171DRAFT_518104 [Polychytrium aggregatum]|uniref:uncharacterized protein n=1 Tax=Polychytrium aggregatum TaxID=110093 RepID=UPI0022FEAD1D|nr:uncharacterized protein BJ171DRAFT_518104 [Polychytrium aggregatum]KAI9199627.1 hypothetical protein BJ171DRAFT_518104 [Polychytrium aggregatum]
MADWSSGQPSRLTLADRDDTESDLCAFSVPGSIVSAVLPLVCASPNRIPISRPPRLSPMATPLTNEPSHSGATALTQCKDFLDVFPDTFDLEDLRPAELDSLPSAFRVLADPFPFEDSREGQEEAQLAPFLPSTKKTCLDACLLAGIGPDDVVLDIGCGDGRVCICATQRFGARLAIGIDYDRELVEMAVRVSGECGVADRTEFLTQDLDSAEAVDGLRELVLSRGITAVFMVLCGEMERRPYWQGFLREFCVGQGLKIVAMIIDKNELMGAPKATCPGAWLY